MLGDAQFARPRGSKDRYPRKKRKSQLWGDVRTVADKGIYGAGAGFVVPGLIPRGSKTVDRVLSSKRMNRVPIVGKALRNQAVTAGKGLALNQNLAAQTTGGLVLGSAGLLYGLNKVRQRRRSRRLS